MYGRVFEKMYQGSLVGAGLAVFGVWNYAIAHVRKSRVELNPKHLSLILTGGLDQEPEIEKAIQFLCRKDPDSRNKDHDGKKLVREGEYQYFMPSYAEYDQIRTPEDLRAYNRRKQAEHRERLRKSKRPKYKEGPLGGEQLHQRAEESGASQAQLDRIMGEGIGGEI